MLKHFGSSSIVIDVRNVVNIFVPISDLQSIIYVRVKISGTQFGV